MSESLFKKNENKKTKHFRQNQKLNELIAELKFLLSPVQKEKEKSFIKAKFPIAFIVGCPRSGTTLILQWMASLGVFAYPSNFLTRFAFAPYIGALIQQMIFNKNYDFNEDFGDIQSNLNFSSDLGKSKGALATNEFQHFFRNYMPNFDPEYLDNVELRKVSFNDIERGIASIEYVFNKPFVTKATMLQYNIAELFRYIPRAIFIYVKRKPIFNMQSILLAREKYYGDMNIWWSVKPKEYVTLKDMDLYHQIAGQVYYTNQAIEDALAKLPDKNIIKIEYENFCRSPRYIYSELVSKYGANNLAIQEKYNGVEYFNVSDKFIIQKKEIKKFELAYLYFKSKNQ